MVDPKILEERIKGHEGLCTYRYGQINCRLSRIERILFVSAAAIMGQLVTIVVALLMGIGN